MLQCAILHHPPTREVIFLVVFHASHKKQQKINKKQQELRARSKGLFRILFVFLGCLAGVSAEGVVEVAAVVKSYLLVKV